MAFKAAFEAYPEVAVTVYGAEVVVWITCPISLPTDPDSLHGADSLVDVKIAWIYMTEAGCHEIQSRSSHVLLVLCLSEKAA